MALLEVKNVKKIYKMGEVEIEALSGVDFSIDQGEFVVIAGASGAGKSTILNMLGGIDQNDDGQIIIGGKDLSAMNNKELTLYRRYDIGFVFQFYNLIQNLTARENVEIASQICKDPMDAEEAVTQMELLGHDFFVFLNTSTETINVVYKRKNGNYGLIEPEI